MFAAVVRHNGWLFYQGGDETFFYTSSWVLAGGHIPEAAIGYGWSYLLTPVARIAGADLLAALPAIVLLQTVVLLPVALACIYSIGARIGGRAIGYLAAVLWVAAPYASIPLWQARYHGRYIEQLLPQSLGLTALGDFPSMVCLLVAAALCLRALDGAGRLDGLLAGLAAGFAVGIKPSNGLFLLGPALAFTAARRGRTGAAFCLGLAPSLLTLALWKYRGLGHLPLLTPTPRALAAGPAAVGFVQVHRYFNFDWHQLHENYLELRSVLRGLVLLQALPVLGFVGALRRAPAKALLLFGWLLAFLLVKGSSDEASIDNASLLRLLIPALPALVLLVACVPLFGERRAHRESPVSRRGAGRRTAVAAFTAFAVLPLLFVAAFPTLRAPTAVKYFDENVLVPVGDLSLDVRRLAGGRRELSWSAAPSPGVVSAYRVFRARPTVPAPDPTLPPGRDGVRCLAPPHGYRGAADCRLEMTLVATTTATRFIDRPPPGPWVYRVALFANWLHDENGGDLMLLSSPSVARNGRRLADELHSPG